MKLTKIIPQHPAEFNIYASCGLIQNENIRIIYQRFGNLESSLHPAGQLPNLGIALGCEAKLFQKAFNGWCRFFLSDSVIPCLEVEEFFDGEEPVTGEVLRRNANLRARVAKVPNDVFTENGDVSTLEFYQSGDDSDGSSLAGTIGSQQTVKLPGVNSEVNPAEGRDIVIRLGKVTDFNGCGHDWNLSHPAVKIRVFVKRRLTGVYPN